MDQHALLFVVICGQNSDFLVFLYQHLCLLHIAPLNLCQIDFVFFYNSLLFLLFCLFIEILLLSQSACTGVQPFQQVLALFHSFLEL